MHSKYLAGGVELCLSNSTSSAPYSTVENSADRKVISRIDQNLGPLRYLDTDSGKEADHGDEADVAVDLLLGGAQPGGGAGAREQLVDVAPELQLPAAGPDEQVRAAQRVVELLQRPPRLRVPPQLGRPLEHPQQASHDAAVLRQLQAQVPVLPRRERRLRDHGD